jgi:hypothetical protein
LKNNKKLQAGLTDISTSFYLLASLQIIRVKKDSKILPYQNRSLEDMKDEFWQEVPGFEGVSVAIKFWPNKISHVVRRNGSQGYWTKDKILSPTVQKVKNKLHRRLHLSLVL